MRELRTIMIRRRKKKKRRKKTKFKKLKKKKRTKRSPKRLKRPIREKAQIFRACITYRRRREYNAVLDDAS